MRDMPEHEKETERARRGHSLTLHADIVTSCGMGDLYVDGKRVSCDVMISNEIQVRKEQRLRNEAAAGGLAVHWVLGELEPRLRSWMARPSTPGVVKECETSRKRDWRKPASGSGRRCESAWSKGTVPIDLQAPKRSSWSMELENGRLIDIGGNEGQVSPESTQ